MVWDTHTKEALQKNRNLKKNIFSLFENKLNKFQFEIIQVTTYNL
jgi:hypothetical protein